MKNILVFCILLSTLLFSKSVVIEGIAPVITSTIEAKNQALLDAKIKAIESEVGVYIKSQTQMENFKIKYDFIEENIEGYVSKYSILEEKHKAGVFKVKIEATVKQGKINSDIENLVNLLNYNKKPKFLIMATGDSLVSSIFESNLKNAFLKNKIDIIEASKLKNGYKELISSQNKQVPYKRLGIDYVVFLKINRQNIETTYKGQKHKSVNLLVTTDVINTSNMELLLTKKFPNKAADNKIIVESDLMASAQDISSKFSKSLIIEIADKWKDKMYNGENIIITVEGLKSFKAMEKLKDYLHEIISDIKTIHSKNYDKGVATFDISIRGGLNKFLDLLIFNNDEYEIEVINKNTNTCTLKLH